MALSKVAIFCAGLEAQLQEAVQQAGAIGIESTLLHGLREDIAEQLNLLRAELPSEDIELKETSSDVVYLQQRAESLQAESRRLRQALATHRAAHGELMRRLALRDMVLEGMRTAALRKQEASFPMELYDRIEAQLTQARDGFAAELEASEKRHAASAERVERRLRKIIDAKEKEIIQLQLHFDQALRAAHGSKVLDVRSAASEVERTKAAANAALQKAQLEFETRVLEAVTKERLSADLRLRDALTLKEAELRYLKTALDEQVNTNKALDDACRGLQSTVDTKTAWLNHVTTIELPAAVRSAVDKVKTQMTSQILTAKASTVAAQTERDAAIAAVEAVKAQLAASQKERDALTTQIVGLRSDLIVKDSAIRETTALRNAALTDITNLKAELEDMKHEVSMMRRITASGGGMSADFMERIDALREQLKDAQRSAEEDSAAAQKEIEQYAKALAVGQEKVYNAEQEALRLRRALDIAQGEIAGLRSELETLRNSKSRLESTVVSQRLQAAAATTASMRRSSSGVGAGMIQSSPAAAVTSNNSPIDGRSVSPVYGQLDTPAAAAHSVPPSATRTPRNAGTAPTTPRGVGSSSNFSMPARDADIGHSITLGDSFTVTSPTKARTARPATRDAIVECLILDFPLTERVTVRAGTAIGRDTARLEARLANAILRDDLARYRFMLDMQRTSDGEDFIERAPVPVSTSIDVRRQNAAMEDELKRRKAMALLHRAQGSALASAEQPMSARRDPIVELLMAAAREAKLHSNSPDDHYVMSDLVTPPMAPRPPTAEQPTAPVDGTLLVHPITFSSARGVHPRPGVKLNNTGTVALGQRPTSAGASRQGQAGTQTPSPRAASAFAEFAPRIRTADIIDPVSYFSVNNRCRDAEALAAEGTKATITTPRGGARSATSAATVGATDTPAPDPTAESRTAAPPRPAAAATEDDGDDGGGYSQWESASPRAASARGPTIALRSYGAAFTMPRPPSAPSSSRASTASTTTAQQVMKRRFDEAVEAKRRETKRNTWTKGPAPLRGPSAGRASGDVPTL